MSSFSVIGFLISLHLFEEIQSILLILVLLLQFNLPEIDIFLLLKLSSLLFLKSLLSQILLIIGSLFILLYLGLSVFLDSLLQGGLSVQAVYFSSHSSLLFSLFIHIFSLKLAFNLFLNHLVPDLL